MWCCSDMGAHLTNMFTIPLLKRAPQYPSGHPTPFQSSSANSANPFSPFYPSCVRIVNRRRHAPPRPSAPAACLRGFQAARTCRMPLPCLARARRSWRVVRYSLVVPERARRPGEPWWLMVVQTKKSPQTARHSERERQWDRRTAREKSREG